MNRLLSSVTVAALALAFILASCSGKASGFGRLTTDSTYINITEHLFGDTAMPACNLVLSHTWIASSDDVRLKDSLNHILQTYALGDAYGNMPVGDALQHYRDNYTTKYRKDYESLYSRDDISHSQTYDGQMKDGSYTPSIWLNFFQNITTRMQLYHKHLAVFSIYREEYTGGAHGIYGTTFLNIDLRTLHILGLKDIMADGNDSALTELIVQQLMADNGASTREELYDMGFGTTGEITLPDNFYIGREGITFYYNIYEIAPYVVGPVAVTIGYDKLKDMMRTDCTIAEEMADGY